MVQIDCAAIAAEIKEKVKAIPNKRKLLILTAGHNVASEAYIKGKISDCEECGIPCEVKRVESELQLRLYIDAANCAPSVGGVIVQLPLPTGWDESVVMKVDKHKDVDGFVYGSMFLPCTPEAIIYLLHKELGDNLQGKSALLIGRGKLVGMPMIDLLLKENCTVTICHSKTIDLDQYLGMPHDIVISAVGKANLIDMCKLHDDTKVLVDVGINRNDQGKLCGDCYNPCFLSNCRYTPVPKGIGLLTRAILMQHMAQLSLDFI